MTTIFPLRLAANADYYAALARCADAAIDCRAPYNKRDKDTHRMEICDTHGRLRLTVPVSIPGDIPEGRRLRWGDVTVSGHGNWWHVHLTALESAYGRTPYFQYLIDRFKPLYTSRYLYERIPLPGLCRAFNDEICAFLGLPVPRYITCDDEMPPKGQYTYADIAENTVGEYWQVWAHRYGFMPGLSVLDLIFNLGPEGQMAVKNY